jgi:hypothetical protein
MSTEKDNNQLIKAKEDFIEALKRFKGDKKKAANSLKINLVTVRSWRHKDNDFNNTYKGLVIGSEQSKEKSDLKEPFIALLNSGLSQRQACDELHISIVTLRTWKKMDPEFKKASLKARFGD